jgi:ABC-2 type transport system ATP-binding protein
VPRASILGRAAELLDRFGLADAADRPVSTYSGGMRRRLDLAAALVHRPPVLFLDEPTTGLDIVSRTDLWRVIEELVGDGTTVLLTTQYLEEADRLADNLAVVDRGCVIAHGTPTELKAQAGTTVIDIKVTDHDQAVDIAERLAGAGIGLAYPTIHDHTVELAVDEGPGALMQVLRTFDAAGLVPAGLTVREPSLDDVFLKLTGHRTEGDAPPDAGTNSGSDSGSDDAVDESGSSAGAAEGSGSTSTSGEAT